MANFFRYIGAAAPALNASARTALDIAREMREGPQRTAESQGRQALTQQRMEQEKYEFEQKKKEDAEMDAPMEGSLILEQFTAGWDEDKKNMGKQMLIKHGIMSPEGITTKRKMRDAQKQILMSKQASAWVQEAKREASLNKGKDLFSKMQKAIEGGDATKSNESKKAYNDWQQEHNLMLGNFEKMQDMRAGMELYQQVKGMGIEIPYEAMAIISTAANTGEGVKDAIAVLKYLATKGKAQGTGRPFSVKGGVYDPEQGFIQAPWEGGGGTEEPPKSRERKVGDKVITEEWDTKTGTWKNLGESPRWEPPKPTGTTGEGTTEGGREYSKADLALINKTLAELPKMKKEANAQETAIKSIDKNLKLIETGQVTGKGGQFKAFIAPYAEMLGVNVKSLSDAQAFQLMSRAIVGPMRLEIVGSGPVSNYEQELMNKISGGGGAARDASKELLTHWKSRAQSKIDDYNNTVTGFSEFYPASGKIYKPIGQSTVKQDPLGIRR